MLETQTDLHQAVTFQLIDQYIYIYIYTYIYIYIYIYIYFYITVRLQQSAQREEQIIGIKNDTLVYNY